MLVVLTDGSAINTDHIVVINEIDVRNPLYMSGITHTAIMTTKDSVDITTEDFYKIMETAKQSTK